jgi:hypothetical protein
MDAEEYADVYRDHDRGVHEFFTGGDAPAERRERFLELDITTLAKENEGRHVWERLCGFLGVSEEAERGIAGTPFPHRFVFQYSSWDQPMAQFRSIVARLGRRWRWLGLAFVLLFASRFWDMSQCTRVCRVANGFGNPDVRGFTGSWLQEGVEGRRMYLAPAECECFLSAVAEKGEGGRILSGSGGSGENGDDRGDHTRRIVSLRHTRVSRYHPPIPTEEQWWFKTLQVCGSDGRVHASADDARRPSGGAGAVSVVNCGQCGACSHGSDTAAMHARAKTLTKVASVGALLYLFAGEAVHQEFFRSDFVGFGDACSQCWLHATQCNLASCARHCMFGWQNPLSAKSTRDGTTTLNECMHCDEVHCSGNYLQACGANRRTAGVVTEIDRPDAHVCAAAREDAVDVLPS